MSRRKRLIQVYKRPGDWKSRAPGVGDFLRGGCHVTELAARYGAEFRFDVSQTEFVSLIVQDPALFCAGDPARIRDAGEHFKDHRPLLAALDAFAASGEEEFYFSTNLGDPFRSSLPAEVKSAMRPFFCFAPEIGQENAADIAFDTYAVLSVRCGDAFFGSRAKRLGLVRRLSLYQLIERDVLSQCPLPIVAMSDSLWLKRALNRRYGMAYAPLPGAHGSSGDVKAVVRDLDLLRRSRLNIHVNIGKPWWSGFSHYTSLIFDIPDRNFVRPVPKPELRWLVGAAGRVPARGFRVAFPSASPTDAPPAPPRHG
jgi:hypothetical protein